MYALDQLGDFSQTFRNASAVTAFNYTEATGLVSSSASGTVAGTFSRSRASVRGRLVQTITNNSDAAIELDFGYELMFEGQTSRPDVTEVNGSAFVELQDFFGQVFLEEIPYFASPPRKNLSGETTLSVGAGETVYASAYAGVGGGASAFTQIPLPGTLPLMIGALAGLAREPAMETLTKRGTPDAQAPNAQVARGCGDHRRKRAAVSGGRARPTS